jgi:hypothetical protein
MFKGPRPEHINPNIPTHQLHSLSPFALSPFPVPLPPDGDAFDRAAVAERGDVFL